MSTQPPVIVTDAACDLPADLMQQYNIHVLPLKISFGEETYLSGETMNVEQFFERLGRGDVHPVTSPLTMEEYKARYEALETHGAPILSIHLSDTLSKTVDLTRQAARQVKGQVITVWDSKTISGMLGFQVLTAARAARAGCSIEQIIPLLEQTHQASNLLFCLDDLSYLVKGGRIGKVSYMVAQTLRIKPIITISKSSPMAGIYVSTHERVHSLSKVLDVYMRYIVRDVGSQNKLRALVMHGQPPSSDLAATFVDQLRDRFEIVLLDMLYGTPIIDVYAGPQAIGVAYIPGDWPV